MKHQQMVILFAMAFGLLTLSNSLRELPSQAANKPAALQNERCKCKHATCIENLITQKESLKEGYENLVKLWESKWLDPSGKPKMTVDVEKDYADQKMILQVLGVIASQMEVIASQVRVMMGNRLTVPEKCGITQPVEMSTDSITCVINAHQMSEAEKSLPCKEIYDIAVRHEVLHKTRCDQRMQGRSLPVIRQTPAGYAREEADAYAQEIGDLQKLLKKLGCKGKLAYDSDTSLNLQQLGTIRFTSKGFWPYAIDDNDKIKGEGTHTVNVDTSGSKCTVSGYQSTYALNVEGEAEEEFLQFRFKPKPGYEVNPTFKISCPPGFGFSMPVPRGTGDARMERTDGARKEYDVAAMTGGAAQGKTVLTLHFDEEEKSKPVASLLSKRPGTRAVPKK